jgi:hypothetical protein
MTGGATAKVRLSAASFFSASLSMTISSNRFAFSTGFLAFSIAHFYKIDLLAS